LVHPTEELLALEMPFMHMADAMLNHVSVIAVLLEELFAFVREPALLAGVAIRDVPDHVAVELVVSALEQVQAVHLEVQQAEIA
jgi:hypothetical protein